MIGIGVTAFNNPGEFCSKSLPAPPDSGPTEINRQGEQLLIFVLHIRRPTGANRSRASNLALVRPPYRHHARTAEAQTDPLLEPTLSCQLRRLPRRRGAFLPCNRQCRLHPARFDCPDLYFIRAASSRPCLITTLRPENSTCSCLVAP